MPHILAWNFPDTLISSKASTLSVALITSFSARAPCDDSIPLVRLIKSSLLHNFSVKHPPTNFQFRKGTTRAMETKSEVLV